MQLDEDSFGQVDDRVATWDGDLLNSCSSEPNWSSATCAVFLRQNVATAGEDVLPNKWTFILYSTISPSGLLFSYQRNSRTARNRDARVLPKRNGTSVQCPLRTLCYTDGSVSVLQADYWQGLDQKEAFY